MTGSAFQAMDVLFLGGASSLENGRGSGGGRAHRCSGAKGADDGKRLPAMDVVEPCVTLWKREEVWRRGARGRPGFEGCGFLFHVFAVLFFGLFSGSVFLRFF